MNDISLPIQTITAIQLAMQKVTGADRRGQHPKMHGCLEATFSVRSGIPAALKIGIFATPKDFQALIRLSNGAQSDDRKADIHGMAIKLLNVPGPKVLEAEANSPEQDFILTDNPVFFIRNAADYAFFVQDFAASAAKGLPPERFAEYLKNNHPEDIPVLMAFRRGHIQDNPLNSNYWSQVPYAFGLQPGTVCRYRCSPVPASHPTGAEGPTHDYLRERLVERLKAGQQDAVFDFAVQVKSGADASIIDNPTVEWPEPFISVATIRIAPQTFDTAERRLSGEHLSFSPWHALAEHRPVGEINEIRKVVYLASKNARHRITDSAQTTPAAANQHQSN